jgi:hypothetical protein
MLWVNALICIEVVQRELWIAFVYIVDGLRIPWDTSTHHNLWLCKSTLVAAPWHSWELVINVNAHLAIFCSMMRSRTDKQIMCQWWARVQQQGNYCRLLATCRGRDCPCRKCRWEDKSCSQNEATKCEMCWQKSKIGNSGERACSHSVELMRAVCRFNNMPKGSAARAKGWLISVMASSKMCGEMPRSEVRDSPRCCTMSVFSQ